MSSSKAELAQDQGDSKRRKRRKKPKRGAIDNGLGGNDGPDNEADMPTGEVGELENDGGDDVDIPTAEIGAMETDRRDSDNVDPPTTDIGTRAIVVDENSPPSSKDEVVVDAAKPSEALLDSSATSSKDEVVVDTEKASEALLDSSATSSTDEVVVDTEKPSEALLDSSAIDEHDVLASEKHGIISEKSDVISTSLEVDLGADRSEEKIGELAVTNVEATCEPNKETEDSGNNDPEKESLENAQMEQVRLGDVVTSKDEHDSQEPDLVAETSKDDRDSQIVFWDADPETFQANKFRIVHFLLRSLFASIALRGVSDPAIEEVEKKSEKPPLPPMDSMVWLELKKGVLTINPDATEVFAQESGYVNPVMISGRLRTGKSYLMNALSDSQAFGVSSQARSFTQGVHACNRLAPCSLFGGPEDGPQLAFLDAEGQADKGKSYDIKMATPLLLVSKVIIMNEICPTGPSKEDILRTLEIMMRAAEQVADRKKRKKLFGNLHVMMRDCSQEEAECWSIIFDQEDPEISETMEQVKAIEERNMIRESILAQFESEPKVWCLPPLKEYPAPKNYRDCRQEYVDKIGEIRAFMALQLAYPKLLDDKPLTGSMIAALMPQLQEALKSDSPILNPPSMMQAVCDLEAERIALKAGSEADKFFRVEMSKRLPLASPYYEGEVDCVKALLADAFRVKLEHLPKESQEKVFGPFESRLTLMDERLAALNREKLAERATQQALNRAKELEDEMAMERMRADEARAEVDKILAERDSEKERVEALLLQMQEIDVDRQAEKNRIKELEDFINKEASDREAELQRQIEEEQRKVEEAEQALRDEAERQKEAEDEQAKLMEEQRLQMEEMQREIDEERKAREEAERELGMREEERELEDEAAEAAESAAEAKKEPPLIYAVKNADVLAVRGIIRHHPDSLHTKDKNQRTALHFCEDEDCAQALIKGKADPNAQDMGLWSPLHNAASKGFFEIAELILNANGNVLLTTKQGNTPLDLSYEQPDMTAMLLSAIPELYDTLELDEAPGAARARSRKKNTTQGEDTEHGEPHDDVNDGPLPELAEHDSQSPETDLIQSEDAKIDDNIVDSSLDKGHDEIEDVADENGVDLNEEEASEVIVPTSDEEVEKSP